MTKRGRELEERIRFWDLKNLRGERKERWREEVKVFVKRRGWDLENSMMIETKKEEV